MDPVGFRELRQQASQIVRRVEDGAHITMTGVRAERLRRLTVLERQFDPLPVYESVASGYGQLAAAAVVAVGRQPRARAMDLLIAATAMVHDARNAGDLHGLEQLVEIVPA